MPNPATCTPTELAALVAAIVCVCGADGEPTLHCACGAL